jgi:hypothetical protein
MWTRDVGRNDKEERREIPCLLTIRSVENGSVEGRLGQQFSMAAIPTMFARRSVERSSTTIQPDICPPGARVEVGGGSSEWSFTCGMGGRLGALPRPVNVGVSAAGLLMRSEAGSL